MTEVCEQQQPHLITHVATTPATTGDEAMVDEIHEELKQEHLLPSQHFLDAVYVNAQALASSQHDYEVEMVGPARADCQWQASQAQGFEASQFVIDWEHQHATCPQGHTGVSWTPTVDSQKNEIIKIRVLCASS